MTPMSPRQTILRELSRHHERNGHDTLTRPSEIAGFAERPADYQKAVNQLLQDRLIQGRTDDEGRLTIGINDHRAADVRKAIRPVWLHPGAWVVLVAVLAAAATLVA